LVNIVTHFWIQEIELACQEQIELLAVKAGLKSVQRIERPAAIGRRLATSLTRHGFCCVEATFHLVTDHWNNLGDTFVRIELGQAQGRQRTAFYIALLTEASTAAKLGRIEATTPGSLEVGRLLGYPECCIEAYEQIHRGGDWVLSMLRQTPIGVPVFSACNRLARLFGDWALLPDYYPCSFSCVATAAWSSEIVREASKEGLADYIQTSKLQLLKPIRVERDAITIADTPSTIRYHTGLTVSQRLLWVEY
jgi:hypothetical protein